MNGTDSSGSAGGATDPRSGAAVVVQSAAMMVIIISAVCGNLLILAAIYIDKTLQTLTNAFIVNLACADFLLAVLGMPFTLASSITYDWIFGSEWCIINGMANSLFCVASILTLAAVSVDRYIAILHPFRYSMWMTRKTVTGMITYIWLHSFVIAIMPAAGWSNYTFLRMESICTVHWDQSISYTLFLFSFCFFVPLAVIMFTYYKIFRTANKQSKRVVPVTGQIVSPTEQDYDDEMSSMGSVTPYRPSCTSVNETELKRSGVRPCILEVARGSESAAEMAEPSPSSKDSGFDEPNSSSVTSLRGRKTSDQPKDAEMQRNAGESAGTDGVTASVSPSSDVRTCSQGVTDEASNNSKPEFNINAGGAIVRVPNWYVENKRAGAFKHPDDCGQRDPGLLPAIPQQRTLVQGKGKIDHTTEEGLSAHQVADKAATQENGQQSSRALPSGPIPAIVSPPSNSDRSGGKEAKQPKTKRQKSAGRKMDSSAFSLRDGAQMLSPTLFVLGQKSRAALLRSRRRSSDYKSKLKRDRKAAKTIVIVLGTFILLWGPHFVGIFCLLMDSCGWPDEFYAATTWLAMLNSACNPVIYGVMSRQFRKRFFQILRCRRGFF